MVNPTGTYQQGWDDAMAQRHAAVSKIKEAWAEAVKALHPLAEESAELSSRAVYQRVATILNRFTVFLSEQKD